MMKESIYNRYYEEQGKLFCYNSLSKAKLEVDDIDSIKRVLDQKNLCTDDIKILKKNGFIIEDNVDEYALLRYAFNKIYFRNDVQGVILLPTLKCNFTCPYCFESGYKIHENPRYFEALEQFLLKKVTEVKQIHIGLFGGEPLLKWYQISLLLSNISQQCLKHGTKLVTSIVTNGSLLNEEIIEKLITYNCTYFQITFDGDRERHNKTRVNKNGTPSFDLLMKNLCLAASYADKNVSFHPVMRINIEDFDTQEIEALLRRIPEDYRAKISVLIRRVFSTHGYSASKDKKTSLRDLHNIAIRLGYKKYKTIHYLSSCEACGDTNSFHVLPDLSIAKCINDLNFEGARIGQMEDDGKLTFDNQKLANWYSAANFWNDTKCQTCSTAPECLGGCILSKLKTTARHCISDELLECDRNSCVKC